jgi:hypothetical protein
MARSRHGRSALARTGSIIGAGLIALALAAAPTAASGSPAHFGPFENSYTFIGFNCPGFDVLIEGSGSDSFTVWTDDVGQLARVLYRGRYPRDTLTNTVSGRSIVVRGEFQETIERIGDTDEYTKTITGFRYLVNEPATGVTVRDVGRIVYGDLEQTVLLWEAGKHELVFEADIDTVFCAALA